MLPPRVYTLKVNLVLVISVVFFVGSFAYVGSAVATPAPSSERRAKLIDVSSKAEGLLSSSDALREGVFRFSAGVLMNQDLSDIDKLGLAYLALKHHGLAFNGTIALPARLSYLDFMLISANWLADDARANEQDEEIRQIILGIIGRNFEYDPLSSSFGFILAAGIAPAETATKLSLVLSSEKTMKGRHAPIVLHNFCVASILLTGLNEDTKELSEALSLLLPKLVGEEQREDVLIALSVMGDSSAQKAVFAFLNTAKSNHGNLDYETALLAYRTRMKPDAFTKFYNNFTSGQSDPGNRDLLAAFKKREYTYAMTSNTGTLKVWDEFDVFIYDDGIFVRSGDLQDFMSK